MFEQPAQGEAIFYNFTDKPFAGKWDGATRTFQPGERVHLVAYKARHYAWHLTNSVLMEMDKRDGVSATYTSPEVPEDVQQFMDIFNKCYLPVGDSSKNALDAVERDRMELLELRSNEPTSQLPETPRALADIPDTPEDEDFEGLKPAEPGEDDEPVEVTPQTGTLEDLRAQAKALKIRGYGIMKEDKLREKIASVTQ